MDTAALIDTIALIAALADIAALAGVATRAGNASGDASGDETPQNFCGEIFHSYVILLLNQVYR